MIWCNALRAHRIGWPHDLLQTKLLGGLEYGAAISSLDFLSIAAIYYDWHVLGWCGLSTQNLVREEALEEFGDIIDPAC